VLHVTLTDRDRACAVARGGHRRRAPRTTRQSKSARVKIAWREYFLHARASQRTTSNRWTDENRTVSFEKNFLTKLTFARNQVAQSRIICTTINQIFPELACV
jgi:hypothetical protein